MIHNHTLNLNHLFGKDELWLGWGGEGGNGKQKIYKRYHGSIKSKIKYYR